MSDVETWSPTDESNTAAPPNGWPEFMMPSGVNNCGRMMMGAVRRMYDKNVSGETVLPYLKLSGGTVSGTVTINGGLITTAVVASSSINATGTIYSSSGISTPGNITSSSLTVFGGLTSLGTVSTGNINSDGSINVTGNIGANGNITTSARITAGSGEVFGNGWALSGTGGNLNIGTGTTGNLGTVAVYANTLDVKGAITAVTLATTGAIAAGNQMFVNAGGLMVWNGNITANTGALVGQSIELPDLWHIFLDASYKYHLFVPGYYWAWSRSGGMLQYTADNAPLWIMRPSDRLCYNATGPVGGVGDYLNVSDRRTKNAATITPATAGLPEILQLQPVEFQRVPTETVPTPMWELGFVAQDVAAVLPQAVSAIGIELPDGTGGLETTEPTLGVTSGAIVAAMVNALKTIDQRLTAGGL